MGLRKLAKDVESGKNGCPTVYADDNVETSEETLVVQGDTLAVEPDGVRSAVGASVARLTGDGMVIVQGDRVLSTTESELENVLPGESAVPISPAALFGATDQQALDELLPGQVRVRIKAATIAAAKARYHEEAP